VKGRKHQILGSKGFSRAYGLPFVTMYNLIELAGVDSLDQFSERLTALSALDLLMTINTSKGGYPGQMADVLSYEAEGIIKGGIKTMEELRGHVLSKVQPLKHSFSVEEISHIYQYAKDNRIKSDLLSSVNNYIFNPFFDLPLKEIQPHTLDMSKSDKVKPFLANFESVLASRGIEETKAGTITDFFGKAIDEERDRGKSFDSLIEMIEARVDEPINLDRTLHYYTNLTEFRGILRVVAKETGIDFQSLKSLPIRDTHIYRLDVTLKDTLQMNLANDRNRGFELSNINDVHLASYACYVKVLVDRRTDNLLSQVGKSFPDPLKFEKVDYPKLLSLANVK
jgi:hypothetical protein